MNLRTCFLLLILPETLPWTDVWCGRAVVLFFLMCFVHDETEIARLIHMNEPSVIKSLNFHCGDNNAAHRTARISGEQLLARRGQSFLLTLEMTRPFRSSDLLLLTVETGTWPHLTEERRMVRTVKPEPKKELFKSTDCIKCVLIKF